MYALYLLQSRVPPRVVPLRISLLAFTRTSIPRTNVNLKIAR